ncbi:MAG TPA: LPS export ABC transporter periplasmic protein LptC [Chitinophagales bacterium]|nr:LPS export ABC transporter periplasmic protein LptC [Chitinophagales bacterium]
MFRLKTYQQTYRSNYLFSSVLFFTCLLVLSSCVNDMDEVNKTSKLAEPGVERGKNIELFYSEDGRVKVKVTAPAVTRVLAAPPYTEFTEGLKVDFYNDSLRVTSWLTANYGIRYESDGKTVLKNDVQVLNENNEHLSTEELIWDERKHIIYTEKFVKITTPDQVIYGEGMEADEQLTTYRIKKPQGTIKSNIE